MASSSEDAAATASLERRRIDVDAVARAELPIAFPLERPARPNQGEVDVEEDGADSSAGHSAVSGRRAGDRHRRPLGMEHGARGVTDVIDGDRLEEAGQTSIVIEPQTEELRGLQKRRDALVGLQHSRNRSDQELAGLLHFALGRSVQAELPDLGVDRGNRSIDVVRIDTGTDNQRPRTETWIEGAEGVVGHTLALADVFGQSAAQPELPENVVHDPVAVVRRIAAG